jgi:nucleolar MIF4G domain-containing protein 1
MGLQFSLWGAFHEWGENTESGWSETQDEMQDDKAKLRRAINLGKLYGSLVADNAVPLQVLKVLF